MHYYLHHIGDYRRDTAHLSLVEHGIYRQLLDIYYLNEIPLEKDVKAVARLIGAKDRVEEVDAILGEFFTLTEIGWSHSRCEKEIEAYHGKSESARKSANARWQKYVGNANAMRTHTDGNAFGMLTNNQEPITNNQEEPLTTLSGKPDVNPQKLINGEARLAANRVLIFLNQKTGRAYRPVSTNLDMIVARIREGATEQDCKQVIAKKTREWLNDEKMSQYLRPATLFNRMKFSQYTGELVDKNA